MKSKNHILLCSAVFSAINTAGVCLPNANAAELNTKLPQQEDAILNTKVTLSMQPQPLATALKSLSAKIGLNITFNDALVSGKNAPALNGTMSRKEALQALLSNTGLEAKLNDTTLYIQRLEKKTEDTMINLKAVEVRAKRFYEIGPLGGLGLTKEEIPGNVQSITAKDIKDSHALSLTDLLNSKLQSVNVNDYQGNPFQMDVTYRGFTAGPQIGTPQGLSVFFDGIRVNEPFGDVVNWDMIPMNALAGVDVFPGSNPIFGLGTLGGAFSMKTKSGFDSEGVDMEMLTGSYGRKQLQASGGWNNGVVGLFGAGNFFLEDGWRDNSPSKVNQVFGKASYRGDKLDLNFSTLIAWNDLVGNGLIPSEMYSQDRNGVFSAPDTTKNRLLQFQLSADYFVNDNFTVSSQVYRRKSNRKSLGADVYTDGFSDTNSARRDLKLGEEYACLFNSSNNYGLPDYYVIDIPDPNDFSSSPFLNDLFNTGVANFSLLAPDAFNQSLTNTPEGTAFLAHAQYAFAYYKNLIDQAFLTPITGVTDPRLLAGDLTTFSNGESSYNYNDVPQMLKVATSDVDIFFSNLTTFYYTPDGAKHVLYQLPPVNKDLCSGGFQGGPITDPGLEVLDSSGSEILPDGRGTGKPGLVEGTPVAVLTNNEINQVVDGMSIQLNWNLVQHKFMVGASIDRPSATYSSSQQLGLLDSQRNAFLAPDQIRDQYGAASTPFSNNNFSGTASTKSIYASETWSPVDTMHITGAMRYNDTHVKNTVATRTRGFFGGIGLADLRNIPDNYNVIVDGVSPPTGYKTPDTSKVLFPAEAEKFSYYSLNPSFGLSWQAKPDLNVYGNWAQGTRTPSVIELGCAFDDTPVGSPGNTVPKSIAENRQCSLPSTLSGDPYLPQIKAQTIDLGLRGKWGNNMEWNLGAYRTNLKDDIYLVSFFGGSFFDSIGETRRQGIEAGFSGAFGKAKFSLNYALTDATFQNTFDMISNDNSSSVAGIVPGVDDFRTITVKPGDRMPGVPLHNLNATLSYYLTPKWSVGITAIAHSGSYLRGNENNKHRSGVATIRRVGIPNPAYDSVTNPSVPQTILVDAIRQPTNNPGTLPGYATFNFQTSYKLSPEWTLGLQVNNLFDKEFFSAGRLGVNPFSPSIQGAIGQSGYNYNSDDWLSTNFIAPSAPRGVWFSLNWQFDAGKNKVASDAVTATEASEVKRTYQPLPLSLNRYQGAPKVEE